MKLYTIKDDKAQTFTGVYCFANDAIAIREFDSMFKQGKLGLMNQYPADFALYSCGSLDEATGNILPALALVINFQDFAQEVNADGHRS